MADNTQYQKVKEITDQLEQGIQELFESEKYMAWLRTMSKFHDYSLNNTLLIAFQRPDATLVAGYTAWQKQFGRQVQKGEKAIKILAPAPYKEKVEMEKIDPITRTPVLDADGKPVTEVQEVTRPAFKVVSVFDVSQTEGREIPSLGVDELSGNVREYEMFFEALKRSCPVPMDFEEIEGSAKGYYHQMEQRIAIREGMSQVQTIKTAIHEMAHQRLHAIDPLDEKSEIVKQTRSSKEVEAESVAYTVCQHYGIETSDYSFAYVAGWSQGKETPELKASLNTIRKTANEMITEIDGHMRDVKRERAEQLAGELYDYADEVDPYGSQDSVEYVQEFIRDTTKDLMDAGEKAEGILKWLKETPVATEELEIRGKELMEKVSEFTGIRLEVEATITFYVAECSEFPTMGEFHEGVSLEEAFRIYDQIPAERMNGIKGIGFELHDGSEYDGQYPLMEAGRVDEELINMVQHYKDSPLVQQAILDCKRILEEREHGAMGIEITEGNYKVGYEHYLEIHKSDDGSWDYTVYNKEFLDADGGQIGVELDANDNVAEVVDMNLEQAVAEVLKSYGMDQEEIVPMDKEDFEKKRDFAFAKDMYEKGFVYEDYVLSNRIAYELREDGIDLWDFSSEQSSVIYEAAEKGLNVSTFAKVDFSVDQMKLLAELTEEGTDVTRFVSNGKKMDLSETILTDKQIADIQYFRKVDEIPKEHFSEEQWKTIQRGIRERLDVTQIANPNFAVVEMKDILKELRKEKREAQVAELEATLGLQDSRNTKTKETEKQTGKKKSVLEDLHKKQAQVAGAKAPKNKRAKKNDKEMQV